MPNLFKDSPLQPYEKREAGQFIQIKVVAVGCQVCACVFVHDMLKK